MRAKKSLGQNFLTSKAALLTMRDESDVHPLDVILEIGPGKGVLTEILVFFAGKVIAVEKDEGLVIHLKEKFKNKIAQGELEVLSEDILDFDPELLRPYVDEGFFYKVVANIPYYITGAIIRKFLTAKLQPELMVLLVQKEVAQRIVAKDKKESILSLSVKAYGEPRYIKTVKAGSFSPAPKVDSAILLIENISRKFFHDNKIEEEKFFEWVKAGFGHKRKMLIGNLQPLNKLEKDGISLAEKFRLAHIPEKSRAEDLSLDDWKNLLT